ncbi:hypothetical protein SGQ44_16180 [Flavobacterium sp. Fl-77]|uniref:VCBS repeat-containing protein n=1 Tax=Flavobacterium flavipigmentatum TaxID=2893884 RepID=A0AAJ2VZG8_9FLAO|nr:MULTISPECIES: hypothetical protein [unclassified Flavobacterium]MDX6183735.1 hypothetical protein [Flavobacterium sp. Fl-33]MDX6187304.1 hypothetical protein [Flavobacterium sp. Fl-77]UFH38119.1 hypothetical protein LNP22_15425 [Flavobacterium sp. F-70]
MKQIFKFYILLILGFLSSNSFCQNYNHIVFEVYGDLNKDGLADLVLVKEENKDKHNPFLLEIKFQEKDKSYRTVLSSETAVVDKFTGEDKITICLLESIEIKKGILIFNQSLIRGTFKHKFRFQKNNFELIGIHFNSANPGYFLTVDYNLSTGKMIEVKRAYETDKIIEENITIEKITPLPNLKKFNPLDHLY